MPFVPARPSSLNHLSDEAASLALDKHLGDFVKAAKELNINRGDLRKLTWHNPRILDAVHERMDLFRSGVRSKIMGRFTVAVRSVGAGVTTRCSTATSFVISRLLTPFWRQLRGGV